MTRIYLDHAATTPARPEAIAAMLSLLGEGAHNPSSIHAEGRAARELLDRARATLAGVLGARPREIVFTGGGSESIGLAIAGAAQARAAKGRHIVTSVTEHHAVLRSVDALERAGWSVTRLKVDAEGVVSPDEFARSLRADTTVASIMLANNEIGTLAPIAELARIARRAGVVFHTDAVQAPSTVRLDVEALGVDLLTLSAHKFGGPAGVGVLYVRLGTPIFAHVHGGGQEYGLRAGTENLAGIAGSAVALELAQGSCAQLGARLSALRDRLEAGITAAVADARPSAGRAQRVAGISSIVFPGAPADAMLVALDLAGIAASAGSACAAGSLEPSHVIAALGLTADEARSAIRFSLGHSTTVDEVERALAIVPQIVQAVRDVDAVV